MRFRVILILSIIFSICSAKGQDQSYSEYEVKLVYLYQFAKYFNWPSENDAKDKFIIGIYGTKSLGDLPTSMYEKRKFNNKDCQVITLKSPDEALNCDMVYLIGVEKFDILEFLKAIKGSPVLTVGDELKDFCEIGGMINFTNKDDEQRLELCPEHVEQANLQVSKQLYAISRIIDVDVDEF